MSFKHSHVIPIILGIWFPFTFIVTYIIAVLRHDVVAVFPYISDTGNWSPESCIFSLMLTTGALFMVAIVYIRYRQIRELCEINDFKPNVSKLNRTTLYLGVTASYGVIITASFQETNVFVVHIIGAGMCFGLGTIYQFQQVIISLLIRSVFGNKCVNIFRIFCCVISNLTLILTASFAAISLYKFTGDDITKWGKDDGGYDFHLVSTIAEWILAIATILFLASYTNEFKQIELFEPEISMKNNP